MKTNDKNGIKSDGSLNDKEWYAFYWSYFELMSNQRMQIINFYISIEIVLVGAFFTLLNLKTRLEWMEYVVTATITFMSITFYGLDYRTKTLIHRCEQMMRELEEYYPHKTAFLPMHYINNENKAQYLSYAKLFLIQYTVIGIFGVVCFFLLVFDII